MRSTTAGFAFILSGFTALTAAAAAPGLTVTIEGLEPGGKLPASTAYCAAPDADPATHDISPAVSWSAGPKGTKSYALIMTDLDVPKDMSLMNKPGVTIPVTAERQPFIHWVLVDIPPKITHLAKGAESPSFVQKGKPVGPTDHGLRGANVFSGFYPKDSPLAGPRGGFDGPCPPMNDAKVHRYVVQVYALDIATLGLSGVFFGEEAEAKLKDHILATGDATGTYGGPAG
jgi:Raf kinase inhibitor-like YbhB/YbcL family protein